MTHPMSQLPAAYTMYSQEPFQTRVAIEQSWAYAKRLFWAL